MDQNFINKMCIAYYDDFELYKNHIWENKEIAIKELKNHISLLIDDLKLNDIGLYRSLFEYSRNQQYAMIYYLLDDYIQENFADDIVSSNDGELLTEVVGMITGAILVSLLGVFQKQISATLNKLGNLLVNATNAISNLHNKLATTAKVKNAIIYSNLKTCGSKCGINSLKDLQRFTPLTLQSNTGFQESKSQAACLTACWFDFMLLNVQNLTKSYVECLNNTGENLSGGISPITLVMKEPMSSQCRIYYDPLMEHYKTYMEINNYLHRSDEQLKHVWLNNYHKAVETGFKEAGMEKELFKPKVFFKPNDFKSKNDKPFNKPFNRR